MPERAPADDPAAADARAVLERLGLVSSAARPIFERLTGGVASDIWKVELATGPACVKRALAKLRVTQDWRAPVERNANEVAWLEIAGRIVPEAVPRILAAAPDANLFVMEYLDPARHAVWKSQLRDGVVEPATASEVGARIGRIHAATAGDANVARRFATDQIFDDIRLDPYLVATARYCEGLRESDVGAALRAIAATTAATKQTLVHGDVSPKNILIGPHGPIFLDAECAWYGDPAFDLAFCLNHLLLKCLWRPTHARGYLACYTALADSYLALVSWEAPKRLEARTARLLPGLFLGRVDGKSPVEYLTDERDKDRVRRVAKELLRQPVDRLGAVRDAWASELGSA